MPKKSKSRLASGGIKKSTATEEVVEGTVYEVLTQLLNPHELGFRIREGGVEIGKF